MLGKNNKKDIFHKNMRRFRLAVVSGGILALCFYWVFAYSGKTKTSFNPKPPTPEEKILYESKLDGLKIENETMANDPLVVAVMIDNHPDAWPQTGLSKARIVYEAPVEGVFARFMAIFNSEDVIEKVGPVRSSRPYFLDWASEYGDAEYLHCGGSPDALDLIKEKDIFSVNEYYLTKYFWREKNRVAPHNLYTSSADWQKARAERGINRVEKDWQGWKFISDKDIVNNSADKKISLKGFSIKYPAGHTVEWKYNEENKNFERWVNGKKELDGETPITAENILIQTVFLNIIDEEGRLEIETVGSGEGRVVTRGELLVGFWKKKSVKDRTIFYDDNNEEAILSPGKTWVEIVPKNAVLGIIN